MCIFLLSFFLLRYFSFYFFWGALCGNLKSKSFHSSSRRVTTPCLFPSHVWRGRELGMGCVTIGGQRCAFVCVWERENLSLCERENVCFCVRECVCMSVSICGYQNHETEVNPLPCCTLSPGAQQSLTEVSKVGSSWLCLDSVVSIGW
jgi:hypothetical protein